MRDVSHSGESYAGRAPWEHCLHDLIEAQAARTPELEAVWDAQLALSYAELDARANRCAHFLREMGVGPDVVVGVTIERSVHLMVALLAILKAGGAYLPLDAGLPQARRSFMAENAEVSVVLTQQAHAGLWTGQDGVDTTLCLDSEADFLDGYPSTPVVPRSSPTDLAYVLYTSGSTGKPKGCMLPHGAIANRLIWMQERYSLLARERVLQKTPITFDVSAWELFWPLLVGATVVMAAPGGHKDNHYLVTILREQRIAMCHFVPSMLRFFLEEPTVAACTSLRDVFVSGEALTLPVMQRFFEVLPARLHNLYGPTEAAVDVSHWSCEARPDNKVPIGRPISNVQIKVLDEQRRPVPAGEEGELYIGGVALARGYLNRPDLTERSFVTDPEQPSARLYRTGDRVRELPDGNLDYLGRIDLQVKLRGQRLELGEIEATLRRYPGVQEAAVAVRGEEESDPRLVAYLEATDAADLAEKAKDIRRFVAEYLPDYMVPSLVVVLPKMPVSIHGKLDRSALPWPLPSQTLSEAAPGQAAMSAEAKPMAPPVVAVRTQMVSPPADLLERLRDTVQSLVGANRVEDDADLFDLGATSLTLVRIVSEVRDLTGVTVPVDVLLNGPTLRHLVQHVRGTLTSQEGLAKRVFSAPQSCSALEDLQGLVCKLLHLETIGLDDDLFDLGATSMTLVRIISEVRNVYGISVSMDVLLNTPTLSGLAAHVLPQVASDPTAKPAIEIPSAAPALPCLPRNIALPEPSLQSWAVGAERLKSAETITAEQFGTWLGLLRAGVPSSDASAEAVKYLYASSGGLNAVRTYVVVKQDAVRDLPAGVFYYDPIRHMLVSVGGQDGAESIILEAANFSGYDQELCSRAQVAVFFVAAMRAIAPLYGTASTLLVTVESGYMQQLLRDPRSAGSIQAEPVADFDAERLHPWLELSDDEQLVSCLLAGTSDIMPARDPLTAYLAAGGRFPEAPQHSAGKPDRRVRHGVHTPQWSGVLANKTEVGDIRAEQRHLRRMPDDAHHIPLARPPFEWTEHRLRASQRRFGASPVSLASLAGLLSLARRYDNQGRELVLYPNSLGSGPLGIYLWVREGSVEGLLEGVYLYDPVLHQLVRTAEVSAERMALAYTPYNRQHFKSAAFVIVLTSPATRPKGLNEELAAHLGMIEAGAFGQTMMRYQVDFGLGVCPIGGLLFDRVADVFGLPAGSEPVHSFVGGGHLKSFPGFRPRLLMTRSLIYGDDYQIGDSFELGEYTITSAEIIDFANKYDPQPYHVSEEAGANSVFGGLAASGWNTVSIWMGLYVRALLGNAHVEGSPGVDELRWYSPVKANDRLVGRVEVIDIEQKSPKREILTIRKKGTLYKEGRTKPVMSLIVYCRFRKRPT